MEEWECGCSYMARFGKGRWEQGPALAKAAVLKRSPPPRGYACCGVGARACVSLAL